MPINPHTYSGLDDLGRIPLSPNFHLREFLYSEVAAHYAVPNIPTNPDLAITAGRGLAEHLLEPLNTTFGRIIIRSGYRSRALNDLCNEKHHNCGSSESNRAKHIWDERDARGGMGACATVLIPWFQTRHERGDVTWRAMAWWIHDHLPYSHLRFFSTGTFNLTWSDRPERPPNPRPPATDILPGPSRPGDGMTRNQTRTTAAALALTLIAACGDGATPATQTTSGTFLSERDLHDTGAVPGLSHPVVLRLEGDGPVVHSGDLGTAGEDVFRVSVGAARSLDLHIAADGRRHLAASLVSADGVVLTNLDAANPSETIDLDPGEYQVRIARTSAGGDLLIFFRNGRLSRGCERCDLSSLQAARADLSGASFRGSDLRNAVLAAANCVGTNFAGTDLEEAMLSGAACRDATFEGANMVGASVLGADMSGTDLTAEQRESLNALPGSNDGLGTTAQWSFIPQNLTVSSGSPLIIDADGGGATALNYGTVTIRDGGQIVIRTSAHLSIQSLVVEGGGSAPSFLLAGKSGSDGDDGSNGTSTGACPVNGEPQPMTGGSGDEGTDGYDAPFVAMNIAQITGTIGIEVSGGTGGDGGNGGPGGDGGDGGNGGPGGAGGLGSEVSIYYGQIAGSVQSDTPNATGGQGGNGGAAGDAVPDLTPPCSPEAGHPGDAGQQGAPSEVTVLQRQ